MSLHHLLPLLKITPTRALGNDETPRRASERTVEDVLEEYRVFSRRRIPIDRESAEYYQFDEDLSVMLYRLRQFIDTSMLASVEELLYEAIGQLEETARVLSGVDSRRKARAPTENDSETESPESTQPPANLQPPTPDSMGELIGQKRGRDDSFADPFNPTEDPEKALQTFGEVRGTLSTVEVASALALLRDFVVDLATDCVAVFDIETTELVDRSVPLVDMTISCASVLLFDPSDPAPVETANIVTFWNPEAKRGAPMELLAPMLSAASIIVAYNGNFDLTVTARGDKALRAAWMQKLADPMVRLERFTGRRYRLAQVLTANGVEAKGGSGAEAPGMWQRGEYDALERYNRQDVVVLARLVLLPVLKAPGGMVAPGMIAAPAPAPAPAPPPSQELQQGSAAWHAARKGLLTASRIPSLLGLGPGFSDETWEQLLTDEVIEVTDDMLRGQRLEAVAAELLAQKTGLQLTETGLWKGTLEGIPIAASPDRLTSDGKLVEIKAPRVFSSTPRESTVLQAQLQLHCTKRDASYIVQYVEDVGLLVHETRYDSELLDVVADALGPVYEELCRDAPAEEKVLPFMLPAVRRELKQRLKEAQLATRVISE